MGWKHLTPVGFLFKPDYNNPDNSGNNFVRGIPVVGNLVQEVAGDSPKRRIKMKLRRISVALAGGSVPVSAIGTLIATCGATFMAGGATLLGNSWDSIDNWIDSLSTEDAQKVLSAFDSIHTLKTI